MWDTVEFEFLIVGDIPQKNAGFDPVCKRGSKNEIHDTDSTVEDEFLIVMSLEHELIQEGYDYSCRLGYLLPIARKSCWATRSPTYIAVNELDFIDNNINKLSLRAKCGNLLYKSADCRSR